MHYFGDKFIFLFSSYLKSTFNVVADYFKPDILVYLGDLMDEGSISTLPQFHGYVKRLSNIFDWDYPAVVSSIIFHIISSSIYRLESAIA